MKHAGYIWKEGATQPLVVQLTIYFLTNSWITAPITYTIIHSGLCNGIYRPECLLEGNASPGKYPHIIYNLYAMIGTSDKLRH
jgi:hypothetical protein